MLPNLDIMRDCHLQIILESSRRDRWVLSGLFTGEILCDLVRTEDLKSWTNVLRETACNIEINFTRDPVCLKFCSAFRVLSSSMTSSDSTAVASSSNSAEILKTASFSRQHNVPEEQPITASDLLMAAYDPAKLHPLADLGDKLDYLLLDDDKTSDLPGAQTAIPSRGWSDDLCYGTGTMYLSGEWDLFQVTLFEQYNKLWPPFLLGLNLPYLDVHPTLDSLLFFLPSHAHPAWLQVWLSAVPGECGRVLPVP